MLCGLRERGMTPMVTLHHFTDPLWLAEKGGWENPTVVERFEALHVKVVEALRPFASLWVTINEPNVYAYGGYLGGGFPPGKKDLRAFFNVQENMARAHAAAYRAIHRLQPEAQVGVAVNYRALKAQRAWLPLDRWPARAQSAIFNDLFARVVTDGVFDTIARRSRIPEAAHTLDFLGVNYYTREQVRFDLTRPGELFGRRSFRPGAELSDSGMLSNEPDGMYAALKWGKRFGVPMIVTENGVENADDSLRPRYLLAHIHQVWRAANFNWLVRGYFHWTLVDNFEWERGWTQRFGLWALDVDTQARKKRPSAEMYQTICADNGISAGLVQQYAPELYPRLFPREG
jgi:beta-glucosidase